MYTYDDLLKKHALGLLDKPAQLPDKTLFIGDDEQLTNQPNIQLYAHMLQPVSRALIEPKLEAVEDVGIVGDGQGVVKPEDFIFSDFDLGNPIEKM